MEDFIGRVGQSYLERKAFAVPQQLENLAKNQLTGGAEKEAKSEESTGKEEGRTIKEKVRGKNAGHISSSSSDKDMEIARLKRQLAHWKFESPTASTEKNASEPKESAISRASNGQKAFTHKAAKADQEAKSVASLEGVRAAGGKHEEMRDEEEASGSKWAKEASIVEISPTRRRPSSSQQSEHGAVAKAEHAGGSKSERGGHANSTTSHATTASEGKRRPPTTARSEHGSTVKSIAAASVNKHLTAPAERNREERVTVESRRFSRPIERESNVYTVEVEEEEVPKRGRKVAGGVVKVEASKGRTLYRVG